MKKPKRRLPPIPPGKLSDAEKKESLERERIRFHKIKFICPHCGYEGEMWDAENRTENYLPECPRCKKALY